MQAPFTDVNPNGRVPAIHDPNTDVTLWESGAIVTYLVDQYDKEHKISYPSSEVALKHTANQWLHFQASGQGPYFGQSVWFRNFHGEKIPSAIERYENEVKRVSTVIDNHLEKTGTLYLTGDKCTYADLAFLPWINMMETMVLGKENNDKLNNDLPHYKEWADALFDRAAVKTAFAKRDEAMAAKQ